MVKVDVNNFPIGWNLFSSGYEVGLKIVLSLSCNLSEKEVIEVKME